MEFSFSDIVEVIAWTSVASAVATAGALITITWFLVFVGFRVTRKGTERMMYGLTDSHERDIRMMERFGQNASYSRKRDRSARQEVRDTFGM